MKKKAGFTLIEVVMALVILSVVMLGLAATTGRLLSQAAENSYQATAVELAHDRLETVLADPDYDGLSATYEGTETGFPGYPDLERTTSVVSMDQDGDDVDAKKVTVTMDGPGLSEPLSRTVVVAPSR